jgi:hypothetical protein
LAPLQGQFVRAHLPEKAKKANAGWATALHIPGIEVSRLGQKQRANQPDGGIGHGRTTERLPCIANAGQKTRKPGLFWRPGFLMVIPF